MGTDGREKSGSIAPMRFFIIFPLSDAHLALGSFLLFVYVCVCVPFLLASVGRKLTLVAIDPKSARVVETNGG